LEKWDNRGGNKGIIIRVKGYPVLNINKS